MTRSPILSIFVLALLAAPAALACGNGECDPPPPPPKPPVVEPPPPPPKPPVVKPPVAEPPVAQPPVAAPPVASPEPSPLPEDDRDPPTATPVIHYSYCCQIEGKMRVGTGWLRDPVTAYEQCRAREERLQSLPECPRRIRTLEGGE
jgi:hypothetical protein